MPEKTLSPSHVTPSGWKYVDGEDVVEVEALNEEPVEHGGAGVLQQDVEALAQVRLQMLKYEAF